MRNRILKAAAGERGFTLIEILVVILIIGILAAIALPSFLGQKPRAEDAGGKSNARNAVSQIESCFVNEQTYVTCTDQATLGVQGYAWVTTAPTSNQVQVTPQDTTGFTVVAAAPSGHLFTIVKNSDGALSHDCSPHSAGGCPSTGSW